MLHHCQRQWPFELADRPKSLSDAPDISFLMPVGGADRLAQFRLSLASVLAQRDLAIEVIVVEHSPEPAYLADLPRGVKHIHLPMQRGGELFNKAWALNVAAREARSDWLLLLDADMLAPRNLAAQVLATMQAHSLESWRFCRWLFNLPAEAMPKLQRQRELVVARLGEVVQNLPMPLAIRRQTYLELGGHDESFQGWGGEDLEFLSRLRTRRHSDGGVAPIVHLWHPPAAKKASGDRNQQWMLHRLAIPAAERIRELAEKQASAASQGVVTIAAALAEGSRA